MNRAPQQVRIGYFGKLPARSDFIKAADNLALVGLLDGWLAEVMSELTGEPRWKLHYDALAPLPFAIVGTRSRQAIAGRILASHDQSQRRFPFLMLSAVAVGIPAAFVAISPLVLAGLWCEQQALGDRLLCDGDPAAALRQVTGSVVAVAPEHPSHGQRLAQFSSGQTLAGLDGMLGAAGFIGQARQLILAIGLLLLPVRENAGQALEKSLALPLPAHCADAQLVASYWLQLIAPFLLHADVELALFFTHAPRGPALVIGFCGAAPQALRAVIDPGFASLHVIGFDDLAWVDEHAAADHRLQQLDACLAQPGLSLHAACMLFRQTFDT